MEIKQISAKCMGIKLYVQENDQEVARAFLYIMHNDLHEEPFGFLEDVFVDPSQRGRGTGTKLVNEVIELAKKHRCYKLIATSRYERPRVHELYERLGFNKHGHEFRMNF